MQLPSWRNQSGRCSLVWTRNGQKRSLTSWSLPSDLGRVAPGMGGMDDDQKKLLRVSRRKTWIGTGYLLLAGSGTLVRATVIGVGARWLRCAATTSVVQYHLQAPRLHFPAVAPPRSEFRKLLASTHQFALLMYARTLPACVGQKTRRQEDKKTGDRRQESPFQ
jgi:hypothetical protein